MVSEIIKLKYNQVLNQDCIEGMKIIPDDTVDLVITDPPFAIDFKAKKALSTYL